MLVRLPELDPELLPKLGGAVQADPSSKALKSTTPASNFDCEKDHHSAFNLNPPCFFSELASLQSGAWVKLRNLTKCVCNGQLQGMYVQNSKWAPAEESKKQMDLYESRVRLGGGASLTLA